MNYCIVFNFEGGGDQEERAAIQALGWVVTPETNEDRACLRWTKAKQV